MKQLGLLSIAALISLSSCSFFKKAQTSQTLEEKVEQQESIDYTSTLNSIERIEQVTPPKSNMVMPDLADIAGKSIPHFTPTFFPVVQPQQKMRNDSRGDGHFGASRGRRIHNGLDITTIPGSAVYCPIEGLVKRVAYPYGTSRRNVRWTGCVIEGIGLYRGYEVKIFYMQPFMIGEFVSPNEIIGKAQAISKKYSPSMIDHLHVEVRYKGILQDPAKLFDLVR